MEMPRRKPHCLAPVPLPGPLPPASVALCPRTFLGHYVEMGAQGSVVGGGRGWKCHVLEWMGPGVT